MIVKTTREMKEMDRIAIQERGIPSLQLMETAAGHVTRAVLSLPGRSRAQRPGPGFLRPGQ